jgi:hypothetical protein
MKRVMDLTIITRNLVNSRKANATARTRRTKPKIKEKGKGKTFTCHKCGGPNHFARKCHTPKHLVELYQKSLKESNNNKRSYEAHFNDMTKEATTSGTMPTNPKMPKLMDNDDMDMENMIMEYNSNDVFGDLK